MIQRVRIQGYKSLEDVEIKLQPMTVFIGPNAAGKSNLFDALGLLSRAVTSKTLAEAFKGHRGAPLEAFYYGNQGLKGLQAQATVEFTLEVDVKLSAEVIKAVEQRVREMREGLPEEGDIVEPSRRRTTESFLRYILTVQMAVVPGYLRVVNEQLVALNQDGTIKASRRAFIEPSEGRLRLRLEGQARPTEHEVGLDYTLVSTPLYPPHYPHITAFREELSRWRFYYFDPEAMRAETPLKEVESLGSFGTDLAAFYNTLKFRNPRQFEAVNRALRSLLPNVQRLDVERTPEGFLRLQVSENGIPFSARVVSEGTLRVLGLLAITDPVAPTTVIGYEEPENGVHPRRLQLIADLLKNTAETDKQILVNTHSPKLPEYFDPSSLVVCRKEKGKTRFTPFQDSGPLLRPGEIEQALEEKTPLMERVLRGDYDG
ncbi:MAG: AAA family ATPase [Anaerolineae bacterium]|nr:AAA family ATPase [Anaerolineae bacterium]